MSSYIVSPETMHRIITHIDMHRGKVWFSQVCQQLQDMGYNLDARSGLDALGLSLFALNEQAVNQRYNRNDCLCTAYEHEHQRATDWQLLKSLQCLMCQCTEGDVPKSKLFEWLESYEHCLMRHIIDGIPEYTAAAWG